MRRRYLITLALALALSACSSAPLSQPTATQPAATPTLAAAPTITQIPDAAYPQEPRGVVKAFLGEVQLSSSPGAGIGYMAPSLQQRIDSEAALKALLGITEDFRSFQIFDLRPGQDVDTAHARVALAFESSFEERMVTLVREGGRWQISELVPAKSEYHTAEDYPLDPAGFVRAFLLALQTGNEPLANTFLNYDMQAQAGNQPLQVLLTIPQMYQSFDVEQTLGDEQGFADVWATLKSDKESVRRLFGLQQSEGRWQIASIMLG